MLCSRCLGVGKISVTSPHSAILLSLMMATRLQISSITLISWRDDYNGDPQTAVDIL